MDDLLDELMDIGDDDITNEVERKNIIKAPFGWVGGKTESLKYILPVIGTMAHRKWVDVFGGSGIVSWNTPPVNLMVYNDAYSGVVDFYRCLQHPELSQQLVTYIDQLMPPHSREQWLRAKAEWCTESETVVRAAKWFYMIKLSVINKGKCYGRATNSRCQIAIPGSLDSFRVVHEKLQRFQIENLDFRTCIKDYDSHDALLYCDPPYIETDKGIYDVKFNIDDYKELLRLIGQCQGTVLLSGYSNTLAESQPYWTNRLTWSVNLKAEAMAFNEQNHKADKINVQTPSKVTEVLWIKESK